MAILGFIITIAILVIVHELGHYSLARLLGVDVEIFSLGFGPVLYEYQSKSNKWRISWIPLGGYVKFYQKDDTTDHADIVCFDDISPMKRVLIAIAGPSANILFTFMCFGLMAMYGIPTLKSTIAYSNEVL